MVGIIASITKWNALSFTYATQYCPATTAERPLEPNSFPILALKSDRLPASAPVCVCAYCTVRKCAHCAIKWNFFIVTLPARKLSTLIISLTMRTVCAVLRCAACVCVCAFECVFVCEPLDFHPMKFHPTDTACIHYNYSVTVYCYRIHFWLLPIFFTRASNRYFFAVGIAVAPTT